MVFIYIEMPKAQRITEYAF